MVEAARRLDLEQTFLKGVIVGMRIQLQHVGNALTISQRDYERLERFVNSIEIPVGRSARHRRRQGASVPTPTP